MLMTISRKGKRRILHTCDICFRKDVTFLQKDGYYIRSARYIWSFIPTKKTRMRNGLWRMSWTRLVFFMTRQKPGLTVKSFMRFCTLSIWRECNGDEEE